MWNYSLSLLSSVKCQTIFLLQKVKRMLETFTVNTTYRDVFYFGWWKVSLCFPLLGIGVIISMWKQCIFVKGHDLHGTFSYFITIFVPDSNSSLIPFMHYDEICFFRGCFPNNILHSFVKKTPWFASSHFPWHNNYFLL